MKTQRPLFLAIALALALPAAHAAPTDARMDKLVACMKMPPASADQKRCLDQLKAMPKPAAPAPTPATAKAPRPAGGGTAPQAAAPAPAPVPADIKAAAATLGVNGPPPPGAPRAQGGSSVGSIGGVTPVNITNMDLETAMMMVQSQRANLLEDQLRTQLESVQARNDDIAKLNNLIAALKVLRPAGTDPEKFANLGKTQAEGRDLYDRLQKAGVTIPTTGDDAVNEPGTNIYDAKQKTIDVWVEQLKGKIDSLNSSQQMDMLRMQSLTNKRNEAFDLMTNFIKKMADSRSSIIGNMR